MTRLLVLVEGQTEQTFFNNVLREHLAEHGVFADCTMVCTSRQEGRRQFRGGHGHKWAHIQRDLRALLRSNPDAVTTMLDFYGFPRDMPGFPETFPREAVARAATLCAGFVTAVDDPRFIPGIVMHEFEGLLFTAADTLARLVVPPEQQARVERELRAIRDAFATPEDIDDGKTTSPSRRLLAVAPTYGKPRHGPQAAAKIGLGTLRSNCPSFNAWVSRIETIGPVGQRKASETVP